MSEALSQLEKWFGYHAFLGPQEAIVERTLAGEELCVVMPTGAGKSICYQLPMLMRGGYGLVVSPLISLMRDQVEALRARGIPAAFVNSSQNAQEQSETLAAASRGEVRLLYVSPERFQAPQFREFLAAQPPSLVAVDEAHCVSQWGHDFRPAYQQIWGSVPELAKVQLCAYTATATPMVRDDIREQLQRPDMADVVAGFRRPNLSFEVEQLANRDAKLERLAELLKERVPTIIYTASRKDAESIGSRFKLHFYHAGLNTAQRQVAQNYFMQDACPVLAATNAFGMGIDRPDIRRVIHFSITSSMEAYYQEAGRAGRDGQPARCILMNCFQDRRIQEFLLEMNNPPGEALLQAEAVVRRVSAALAGQPMVMAASLLDRLAPEFENARQAMVGVRLLELSGVLERVGGGYLGSVVGMVQLRAAPRQVLREHQGVRTQRSMLLAALAQFFLAADVPQWCFTPDLLAALAGLRADQVLRCLEVLAPEQLEWTTMGTDDELMLATVLPLSPGRQTALDLPSLNKKRQLDEKRMEEMGRYAYARGCRQRFILKYFGEEAGNWTCGCCDQCRETRASLRPATEDERRAAQQALHAIHAMRNSYGFRRIVKLLVGEEDEAGSLDLNENPRFGCLASYSVAAVRDLLEALMRSDFLAQTGEYNVLELTDLGKSAVANARFLASLKIAKPPHGNPVGSGRPAYPRRRRRR